MRLASFDIFDTTLLRKCGRPENINALISGDHTEGDSAERAVESVVLMANPAIRDIIKQKRAEGWHIAFISDMYLDSDFLRTLLIREECFCDGDDIYISCEHHARKDLGTLYDIVRKDLAPEDWIHYGDNRRSDYRMARKKGITPKLVDSSYNAAELSLEENEQCLQSGQDLKVLAGIARAARFHFGNEKYATFAADFVAPTYIPYVVWLMKEAKAKGIKRLYFLSRDSYILMKIAEVFAADYGIELRYFFISRRALYLPYVADGGAAEYLASADHHTIRRRDNVDKLLLHLGTSREELKSQFNIEFPYARTDSAEEEQDFLNKIFASAFTPTLQQRAHEKRELMLSYFKQEGLTDDVNYAMVDIGWLGTTRQMMNRILASIGQPAAHFYYFGVRGDVFPQSDGEFTSFFHRGRFNTYITSVAEHYYSASPYPTTIGYKKDSSGRISPIFPEGTEVRSNDIIRNNIEVSRWMATVLRDMKDFDPAALYLYAKNAIDTISQKDIAVDLTPLLALGDFDSWSFVKRLSLNELFSIVCLGGNVTTFDWGSLKLTLPCGWTRPAWQLHLLTGKVRGYIFRKFFLK